MYAYIQMYNIKIMLLLFEPASHTILFSNNNCRLLNFSTVLTTCHAYQNIFCCCKAQSTTKFTLYDHFVG